jgi:4-hydroxythreonine-4-phosphate dehydrogenase
VQDLQNSGMRIDGPFAADTAFHQPNWAKYDVVIAMYHDQALIPIKTVAFEDAVNVTLGLPIVRTSPDHGTAFDLAGTGQGSWGSMLAALRLADKLTA